MPSSTPIADVSQFSLGYGPHSFSPTISTPSNLSSPTNPGAGAGAEQSVLPPDSQDQQGSRGLHRQSIDSFLGLSCTPPDELLEAHVLERLTDRSRRSASPYHPGSELVAPPPQPIGGSPRCPPYNSVPPYPTNDEQMTSPQTPFGPPEKGHPQSLLPGPYRGGQQTSNLEPSRNAQMAEQLSTRPHSHHTDSTQYFSSLPTSGVDPSRQPYYGSPSGPLAQLDSVRQDWGPRQVSTHYTGNIPQYSPSRPQLIRGRKHPDSLTPGPRRRSDMSQPPPYPPDSPPPLSFKGSSQPGQSHHSPYPLPPPSDYTHQQSYNGPPTGNFAYPGSARHDWRTPQHSTYNSPPILQNSSSQQHSVGRGSGWVPPETPALATTGDDGRHPFASQGLGHLPPVQYGQDSHGSQTVQSLTPGGQYPSPEYHGHAPPQYSQRIQQGWIDHPNEQQQRPIPPDVPGTQQHLDVTRYPIQPMQGPPPQTDGGGNSGTPWKNPSVAHLVYGPRK